MKKIIKKTLIALVIVLNSWMVLSVLEIATRSPLADRTFSAFNLIGLLCQMV
jgi:hypothetical protein